MFKAWVSGKDEFLERVKSFLEHYPDRVAQAAYVECQIIMTESKRRCPVAPDGGTLRASGQVHPPEREGRKLSIAMSYGTSYALAVHEHLSEHSPESWKKAEASGRGVHWSSDGTGPKYLEGPINEAAATLLEKIAERVHFSKGEGAGGE